MAETFRVVKATVEQTYLIPVESASPNQSHINGWSVEEVVNSWFTDHDINRGHATRDAYRLGGGDRLLSVDVQQETL